MLRPACSSESMRAACCVPARGRPAAVDGQRREVAEVARQGQAGRRQAPGARAEEHEAAVRRRSEAERDAEARGLAQRLAAAQHLALRRTVVERPDLTVVHVRGAGRAHERVERVVVLHDQAALHGEGVQERTGDQLERGVGICFARDRATHLQERVAPRAREPQARRATSPRAPPPFPSWRSRPGRRCPDAAARAGCRGVPPALPPALPSRKRSRSPGRNCRWPLGVRRHGTTPASAQRAGCVHSPPASRLRPPRAASAAAAQTAAPLSPTPYGLCRPIGLVSSPTLPLTTARAPQHRPSRGYAALPARRGGTLWLRRNTLSGSHVVLTSTRRS